ncbi:protein NRT1/ PTR FAMILY 1.2-like [Prosopis cineraria]|uniref:protein NRT1/ PTR FAMILY 1.2-like n=1 Tax=Prosopis cineraria TaxID=364024 RepID=UPI00240EB970|nr:protein NRT1/ PTR FAMILY 1.2-like [Prosopis cineraria]
MEASSSVGRRKGGLITMPFIIANETLAKVAMVGLMPNMVLYLTEIYNLRLPRAANIIFFWFAASNLAPLLAAFLADSFLGRFFAIAIGSVFSFLGMVFLWITSMIPELRPKPSQSATTSQMAFLASSLGLTSIGAGGLSCSIAFGADQFNNKANPNNQKVLETFISWYIASQAFACLLALTALVYAQDHLGWKVGFGIPPGLMVLSIVSFLLASPLYVKNKPHSSLFTGFARVIVVAFKNRELPFPPGNPAGKYHHNKGSDLLVPTNKLRFLNRACIIKNPEQDITPDGSASNPWSLCTTEQVEELKAIIKVLPLWSTNIIMTVITTQSSFRVLQAKSMDRHVTSNFQIPPGSYNAFTMLFLFITVGIYDRIIIPIASKIAKRPVRISAKTRMGIGLFFGILDLIASAIIENKRRTKAIRQGFADNPKGVVDMSAMWLLVHLSLVGIAEAFNVIAQSEFYYSEFPRTMSSIGSSLYSLGMGLGNLMASLILSIVDGVTSRGGRQSWVGRNLNKGHYDWYFWVLAAISVVNFVYYLVCSWAYGPSARTGSVEEERSEEERNEVE